MPPSPGNFPDFTVYLDSLEVDGEYRHYIKHVPKILSRNNAGEVPMVVMCHGTGGDGFRFWKISGWKEVANREGFIVAFPTAKKVKFWKEDIQKFRTKTKWNDGQLQDYIKDSNDLRDDVLFMRKLVAKINTQDTLDFDRVFLSGFSNGGNFASRIAVEAADIFKSVGVASGSLHVTGSPFRHISVFNIAGSLEYHKLTGKVFVPNAAAVLADALLSNHIFKFTTAFNLDPNIYKDKITPYGYKITFDKSLTNKSNIYEFYMIQGLDHHYPNGTNNSSTFIAAEYFWKKFSSL